MQLGGRILAHLTIDPHLNSFVIEGGIIDLLTRHSHREDTNCQEEAAWGFANLSSRGGNAPVLCKEGVSENLLRLAASDEWQIRRQALWSIASLALHSYSRPILVQLGAVGVAIRCIDEHNDKESLEQAYRILGNLAKLDEVGKQLRTPLGIELLQYSCTLDQTAVLEYSAHMLNCITKEPEHSLKVIRLGGLAVLPPMLRHEKQCSSCSASLAAFNVSTVVATDVNLTSSLSNGLDTEEEALSEQEVARLSEELLPSLLDLLFNSSLTLEPVLNALHNLCNIRGARMKVIEAGVFKRLRELLLDCPSPVQESARKLINLLAKELTPNSALAVGAKKSIPARGGRTRQRPLKGSRLSKDRFARQFGVSCDLSGMGGARSDSAASSESSAPISNPSDFAASSDFSASQESKRSLLFSDCLELGV